MLRLAHLILPSLFSWTVFGCMEIPPAFQEADIHKNSFVDTPIPKEWVIEGQPRARSVDLTGTKAHGYQSGLWECTEGEFNWHFHADEFVHILEGHVIVRDMEGQMADLTAGDVAHFAAGSHTVWKVPKYVKKLWVLDSKPESFFRRIKRRMTSRLSPADGIIGGS